MSKKVSSTVKHLEGDRKIWLKLAKIAMKEAKEDARLIKKLKRKK